jgi:type IV pilus assembly protein PilA
MIDRMGRPRARGFTLVELMLVVAVVGVLAALAIYGVRNHLRTAKTAEALNAVGAISRGAVAAFQSGRIVAETPVEGSAGTKSTFDLCRGIDGQPGDTVPDQMTKVRGKKYQPNTAQGADYETGDGETGWRCLRYANSAPQHYMVGYRAWPLRESGTSGKGPLGTLGISVPKGSFLAWAEGDLDGDGTYADFARRGAINVATSELKLATAVDSVMDLE